MNADAKTTSHTLGRPLLWVAVGTVLALLVPLVAMQFTNEVNWALFDFVMAGILLFGTGFTYVLFARKIKSATRRVVIAVLLAGVLLLIWAELAVGIFGTPLGGS